MIPGSRAASELEASRPQLSHWRRNSVDRMGCSSLGPWLSTQRLVFLSLQLTGIIQAMVDGQPSLQQVLERVDEWMAKEGLLDPNVKSIFVTCGDWDLKVMLPGQCHYLGLPVADYFKQWINLKKAYSFAMGCWPKNGLLDMNKGLSLQHIGRPHSGIDDCKNIANIMKTLAYRGFIFKQTSKPF
eukprot:XP_017175462.1 PREDICTED: ERI1 exoribonuclease 3 isoform X11 [Mus musculus]